MFIRFYGPIRLVRNSVTQPLGGVLGLESTWSEMDVKVAFQNKNSMSATNRS